MFDWLTRMMENAFRDPVAAFIGVVVGGIIGYFLGVSSGRYAR